MSQGGSATAVVTADTSKPDPQTINIARVTNQICIIIGDMVKDGHNVEATNKFLEYGYNVIILYSNIDETNKKEIGLWFDNKLEKQILEIGPIDVKNSENIAKVFTDLASKLANDEWSKFEVTVLIYNAALGLVKLVGSSQESKEDEKKDENEKSGLTFQELAHCHDIGAHGFIHCVKEGVKFIDKKSKSQSYFDIFYGKARFDDNKIELTKVMNDVSNYGKSIVNEHIKKRKNVFLHGMKKPPNVDQYIHMLPKKPFKFTCGDTHGTGEEQSFDGWASVKLTCKISTTIDTGSASDPTPTTYYLTNQTVKIGSITYFQLLQAESSDWQIGANNGGSTLARHLALGTTISDASMALTVESDGHVAQSGVIGSSGNEQWRIEPILALSTTTQFCKQFRFVNHGRTGKTLASESKQYTPSGTKTAQTVYVASTVDISDSAQTWTVSWS